MRTNKYAYRPAISKPLLVKVSETLGELQIDPKKIEKIIRLQIVQNWRWCYQRTLPPGNIQHTGRKIQTPYQNLHGSKKDERFGYAVIWNHQKITKKYGHKTQSSVPNNQQSTDSLSTLVATSAKKDTKNPKTRKIRKLLGQEGDKITLLRVLATWQSRGTKKWTRRRQREKRLTSNPRRT
jgi:hypothetical protein